MDKLFETGARRKYRFDSIRGLLTVEQLFDLPLIASGRNAEFDLNTVAKTVNSALKDVTEDSFVATTANTGRTELENKLEIVKTVIAIKVGERDAAEQRAVKAAKRSALLDALATKENEALTAGSIEDLRKQLAELDA